VRGTRWRKIEILDGMYEVSMYEVRGTRYSHEIRMKGVRVQASMQTVV
jgi:hypothetical protein